MIATELGAARTVRRGGATGLAVAVVAAAGCGALAARPALLAVSPQPVATLVVLYGALALVGVALPLSRATTARAGSAACAGSSPALVATLTLGSLTFAAGRIVAGGHAPAHLTLAVVLANSLAALAEELWFRRVCYALLAPAGTPVAVAGTAVLFAAVHVAAYGWWVVPLDLAAGLLLGWQRATSGSWVAPAVTHVVANVLVLL